MGKGKSPTLYTGNVNTNIEAQVEGVDEDALIRQGLHRV
jgi:hypothetical protein